MNVICRVKVDCDTKGVKFPRNFKSLDASIPDAKTLYQSIKYIIPLENDAIVGKPLADKKLNDLDLLYFKIDVTKLDRLYYFEYHCNKDVKVYTIYARTKYYGRLLFFEFYVYTSDRHKRVTIFMSKDANLFMKSVLDEEKKELVDLIRQSLDSDGIYLDENIEEFMEYYNKMIGRQYPFQNLRISSPEELDEYFKNHADILPESLIRKKDDFKKYIAIRSYYQSNSCFL